MMGRDIVYGHWVIELTSPVLSFEHTRILEVKYIVLGLADMGPMFHDFWEVRTDLPAGAANMLSGVASTTHYKEQKYSDG